MLKEIAFWVVWLCFGVPVFLLLSPLSIGGGNPVARRLQS